MKRIFLVEDDPDIARNLSRLLGAEGYAVTRAAGQGEAMARLEGGGFDLALVDISLPTATASRSALPSSRRWTFRCSS